MIDPLHTYTMAAPHPGHFKMAVQRSLLSRNPSLYANKVILAPMVRVGSLPMRLLALNSGAGKLALIQPNDT